MKNCCCQDVSLLQLRSGILKNFVIIIITRERTEMDIEIKENKNGQGELKFWIRARLEDKHLYLK